MKLDKQGRSCTFLLRLIVVLQSLKRVAKLFRQSKFSSGSAGIACRQKAQGNVMVDIKAERRVLPFFISSTNSAAEFQKCWFFVEGHFGIREIPIKPSSPRPLALYSWGWDSWCCQFCLAPIFMKLIEAKI